jgi:hypothetical protein
MGERNRQTALSRLREGYCESDLKDAGETNWKDLAGRFDGRHAAEDGVRHFRESGAVENCAWPEQRQAEVLGSIVSAGLGQHRLLREGNVQARVALADGQFRKRDWHTGPRADIGDAVSILRRFNRDVAAASKAYHGIGPKRGCSEEA